MTSFCIFAEKDRRAFRLQTDTDRVSVHDLLDSARRYRNWHCYGKEEGASCPMQNGIAIAVPGGHSLRVWYYLVIRILVEALKDCYEKETKSADLRRKFLTDNVAVYQMLTHTQIYLALSESQTGVQSLGNN